MEFSRLGASIIGEEKGIIVLLGERILKNDTVPTETRGTNGKETAAKKVQFAQRLQPRRDERIGKKAVTRRWTQHTMRGRMPRQQCRNNWARIQELDCAAKTEL